MSAPEARSSPSPLLAEARRLTHILDQFSRRAIAVQTRGSFLGVIWWALDPLLMLGLYSVVFGLIMSGGSAEVRELGTFAFPLYIFVGLTFLGILTEAMAQSPHSILGHANLVKKVVFPVSLLPLADLGASFLRFALNLVLLLVAVQLLGPGLRWSVLLLPLVAGPLLLMAIGAGWIMAGIGVYFRDLQHFVRFTNAVLFYGSAVFYDLAAVRQEPAIWAFLRWNPVLQSIAEARKILLFHEPLNGTVIGALWLTGAAVAVLGWLLLQKLRRGFADVL